MAIPTRLDKEAFPCYRLAEQRRMHKTLMAFPNRTIYNNRLRAGPGMDVSLDAQMPGLHSVLASILQSPIDIPSDDLRRRYIQVAGERKRGDDGVSTIVDEHIDVFMRMIFPPLFEYFREKGRKMREEVMIICAYAAAVRFLPSRGRHRVRCRCVH